MSFKFCPRCKQEKSTEDFYNDPYMKDGFSVYCRPCNVLRNKDSKTKRALKQIEQIDDAIAQNAEASNILLEIKQTLLNSITKD